MRETQVKTVDGSKYTFHQLGAKESLRLLTRISKIVGKPLAIAAGGITNNMNLATAVECFFQNAEPNEVLAIAEILCGDAACLCDDQKVNFDLHYEGRLDHLFRVFQAALEVQYGNFFVALRDLIPLRVTSTQAPSTSTGRSGGRSSKS